MSEHDSVTATELAQECLGFGVEEETILRRLQEEAGIPEAEAIAALAAVRRRLGELMRRSDEEHAAEARQVYAAIKRDQDANTSQKMRAQQQLDELLGLPERFAAMHFGGADDADVIEAIAFYRSLLYSPQSNVAQRLRAQAGLDRLRRLVAKKSPAVPVPVAEESPAPSDSCVTGRSSARAGSVDAAVPPAPEFPGK